MNPLTSFCSAINTYLPSLDKYLIEYNINSKLRLAHFLAQTAHETQAFHVLEENLKYSAKGLLATFPKYFTASQAEVYKYDVVYKEASLSRIANRIYGGRLGNDLNGDGYKYRGRGLIQLTGKDNYNKASIDVYGDDRLLEHPELLCVSPDVAVEVAAWWWEEHGLNALADRDDCKGITKVINGGYNGLEDRLLWLQRAKKALGI